MHTKLSALGTFIRRNDPDHVSQVIGETIEIFGAERCIWGSNFPIEKLWTDYASILNAAKRAVSSLPEHNRDAVLGGNATRLYRL